MNIPWQFVLHGCTVVSILEWMRNEDIPSRTNLQIRYFGKGRIDYNQYGRSGRGEEV